VRRRSVCARILLGNCPCGRRRASRTRGYRPVGDRLRSSQFSLRQSEVRRRLDAHAAPRPLFAAKSVAATGKARKRDPIRSIPSRRRASVNGERRSSAPGAARGRFARRAWRLGRVGSGARGGLGSANSRQIPRRLPCWLPRDRSSLPEMFQDEASSTWAMLALGFLGLGGLGLRRRAPSTLQPRLMAIGSVSGRRRL
jgi:hypothetical protein